MHFSNLVIHSCDIQSKMEVFNFEYEYDNIFEEVYNNISEAKKEYEDYMNDEQNFVNDIEKFIRFKKGGYKIYHNEINGYISDDKGRIGYMTNPKGIYDWFEVGGRWENILPLKNMELSSSSNIETISLEEIDFNLISNIITYDDEVIDLHSFKTQKKMRKLLNEKIKQAQESGEQIFITIVDCHS